MTDELSLDSATLTALRNRHVAYVKERLTDAGARGEFVRGCVVAHERWLARPIREVLDPDWVTDRIAAVLTEDLIRTVTAPIGREIHRRVLAALREDDTRLGAYVPADARAAIDRLVARPDLFPEELIRRIFEEEASEEVLRDVVYDALKEFNDSVNPFFAEWGLPALLRRFMPIGSGTVLKSIAAVRGEFDKRLEPEMRKFLLVFTRRSKSKVGAFIVAKAADPKFVTLRQSIVAFFYEQTLRQTTERIDDDARAQADIAVESIWRAVVAHEQPRKHLRAQLVALLEAHGDQSVDAFLTAIGVTERPSIEPLAEAAWEIVRPVIESSQVTSFVERLTWEFYESVKRP